MSKNIDSSSIKLSADCGNGFETVELENGALTVEGNCLKLKVKCCDNAQKFRLSMDEKYVLMHSVSAWNQNLQNIPYYTNGYSVKKDVFAFEGVSPELVFILTDFEDKSIDIAMNLIDFEQEKESYGLILSECRSLAIKNKHLKSQADDLKEKYKEADFKYNEILGSFYWRVLGLPRRFTTRIVIWARKHPPVAKFLSNVKKAIISGPIGVIRKLRSKRGKNISFKISSSVRRKQCCAKFDKEIKISILVPLYNTPEKYLNQMINSVRKQTYSNWELCLADGSTNDFSYVGKICKKHAAKDSRIIYKKLKKNLGISENTNACIEMSSGNYIGLFDHDDLLHPSALYEVMRAICDNGSDFIYTDEVIFENDNTKKIAVYNLKSDFGPDTLRSYNYICHFSVFSRELMNKAGGGFNSKYDGSQDYDLILRLTEKAQNITHIPKVLYFWRSHSASTASSVSAKPYIMEAAHRALEDHMKRVGLEGTVLDGAAPSIYRIKYEIKGEPLISIIIPNKDHIDDLEQCLVSLYNDSTYRNFEVIVIENNSTEPETFIYYEKIKRYSNLKVLYWEREFNYSAINNFGVKEAKGDYILLLNNDLEVIAPEWLEEMLMYAQRADVGAVGAKLYYPDDTVQHAGVILGVGGVAGHAHKGFGRYDYGYMTRARIAQNLTACTAACLMMPKKVYDEVGGLEEGYAVAFNDVDLCMKIRKAGYLIVFTPYAELYHYESKSRGAEDTPEKTARFNSEVALFESRWGDELQKGDPYYNPNLTLNNEDFSLK